MSSIKHAQQGDSRPYEKPLKCIVAAVGDTRKYTTQQGDQKSITVVGLVDKTAFTKAIVYNETLLKTLTVNTSILVKNFIAKPTNLVLTSTTKVYRCAPLTDIPPTFFQEAVNLVHPPDAAVATVQSAKTSPIKTTTTLRGYIIQDEAIRTVEVRQQPTEVRTILLEDDTGKVKLPLWRDLAKSNITPGNYVQAKNVLISSFNNEVTLGSTSRTTLEVLPTPVEKISVSIAAFSKEDLQYELITTEDKLFIVEEGLLATKYGVKPQELENYLQTILPFKITGNVQSKTFTSLE